MKAEKESAKTLYNLLIVDESGSMSLIQREALSGINETLTTCQAMQKQYPDVEQRVTLVTFDSNHFNVHYDNVPAPEAKPLTTEQYRPCGCTPLYDSIGKAVSRLNAQVGEGDKVLVTIITDGEENSSREYNLKMVKTLIDKLKKQEWTFALIGTDNLDVEGMAGAMSIDNHLSFREDGASTTAMFAHERKGRINLCHAFACGIDMDGGSYFSDPEDE